MSAKFFARWIVIMTLLILTMGIHVYAQEGAIFTNVASLLEMGIGARPLGMGGAFVGLADDESAAFYNPAALAFLEKTGFTSLFSRQFGTFNYGSIGVAGRFLGLNFMQLDSGTIEITDQFGTGDGESFRYLSRAGIGSFGISLEKVVAFGIRAKFFQAKLSNPINESGFGWSIDPAAMLRIKNPANYKLIKDFRVGLLYENVLKSRIKFHSGHLESWRSDLHIGVSVTLEVVQQISLNFLCDFNNLLQNGPTKHLGVELWANGLGVRAGFNNHVISTGTSIWVENLRIDWAYTASYSNLPDNTRFSATLRF